METELNEKESLQLINEMISTARNNLQKGMGNIFLLWGYLVTVISLLNFLLLIILPHHVNHNSYFIWFIMGFGYPFHYRMIKKMQHEELVKTYIDKIMNYVWIAFSVSILLVVIGMIGSSLLVSPTFTEVKPGFEFLRWFQWTLLPPIMLILYGFALYISGKAYEFRPLVRGGIICWIASLLLIISVHHVYVFYIQQLVLAIASLFGFIIPGYILNKKEKGNV